MSKVKTLTLKCKDGVKKYKFTNAFIKSKKYSMELKSNSIHTTKAIQLRTILDDVETFFIFKQPMLFTDQNSNIEVWTVSTIEEATLVKKYEMKVAAKQLLDQKRRLVVAKNEFGLTQKEILTKALLETESDYLKMVNDFFSSNADWGSHD